MTKLLTIIAAAASLCCGSIACSSTITAEPWLPKRSRSDAAEREQKDAAVEDAAQADSDDNDAGE